MYNFINVDEYISSSWACYDARYISIHFTHNSQPSTLSALYTLHILEKSSLRRERCRSFDKLLMIISALSINERTPPQIIIFFYYCNSFFNVFDTALKLAGTKLT